MRKIIAIAAFLLLAGFIRGIEERIERISSEIDSTVGVAAVHIESGRRIGVRADERFPMGSVNKLPIALAFMREIDAGRRSLSDQVTIEPSEFAPNHSPIRERAKGRPVTMSLNDALEAMLKESDNTAADVLLRVAGGPAAVTGVLRDVGVNDIDVSRSKLELGADLDRSGGTDELLNDPRDTTTPEAMLILLERFYKRQLGLSAPSYARLEALMVSTSTGERRIKAGAPPRAAVAHKTGTLPGTVNDVGIITSPDGHHHVLIAIFTKGGRTSTMTQRERALASITRAVYRDFVGWSPFRRAASRSR